ncbi:MAG: hypothetical protein FWF46_00325 [Oscillospiraceae bacterium]|nr:hypothetical protein [Oscillospiraceae bacterium]
MSRNSYDLEFSDNEGTRKVTINLPKGGTQVAAIGEKHGHLEVTLDEGSENCEEHLTFAVCRTDNWVEIDKCRDNGFMVVGTVGVDGILYEVFMKKK